jgi:hypothetical protein
MLQLAKNFSVTNYLTKNYFSKELKNKKEDEKHFSEKLSLAEKNICEVCFDVEYF